MALVDFAILAALGRLGIDWDRLRGDSSPFRMSLTNKDALIVRTSQSERLLHLEAFGADGRPSFGTGRGPCQTNT